MVDVGVHVQMDISITNVVLDVQDLLTLPRIDWRAVRVRACVMVR